MFSEKICRVKKVKEYYLYGIISVLTIVILINGYRIIDRKWHLSNAKEGPGREPLTEVEIPITLKDLGSIERNGLAEATFKIVNKGKAPLVIKNITVDCHCTLVTWNKAPVLPKDSTNIRIRYDSSQPGYFQKKAVVYLNANNSPVLLLIRGEVVVDL